MFRRDASKYESGRKIELRFMSHEEAKKAQNLNFFCAFLRPSSSLQIVVRPAVFLVNHFKRPEFRADTLPTGKTAVKRKSGFGKPPFPKLQIPKKSQAPGFKSGCQPLRSNSWSLGIGLFLVSGIWSFRPPPPDSPTCRCR